MSIHTARCGRTSSQGRYDGDGEDGAPGLDTTNGSGSTEAGVNIHENNMSEEDAASTAIAGENLEQDIEEGGDGGTVHHECCICMDEIETGDELIGCTGTTETHHWHTECGLGYVLSAVMAGGAFEGVRTQQILAENQQEPLTSAAGELPCPSFAAGCDCAALPNDTIFRMLACSLNASEQFMRAYRNVSIREAIADQLPANINNDDEEATHTRNQLPVVDQIYHRVTEALSRGYQMSCPRCPQQ